MAQLSCCVDPSPLENLIPPPEMIDAGAKLVGADQMQLAAVRGGLIALAAFESSAPVKIRMPLKFWSAADGQARVLNDA
jgi:hypothetical protein